MKHLLLLVALASVSAVALLNQRAVGRLRQENEALQSATQEARQLVAENNQLPQLRQAAEEAQKLRLEVQDLPGLRNQVRQLRRQAEEIQKLRSENERLTAATKDNALSASVGAAPLPADFIPRAGLADAGTATPEATVQTAFWAMCQGNFERMAQCFLDNPATNIRDADSERRRMVEGMRNFPGFRIAERKDISDHEVVLGLQSSPGGGVMPMKLSRVGNEWKVRQ